MRTTTDRRQQIRRSQDMIDFETSCIAIGLRSATITLNLLNQNNRAGFPIKRVLVKSLCYGFGFWLWFNIVAQIAVNFQ